jgi:hypothetical protein
LAGARPIVVVVVGNVVVVVVADSPLSGQKNARESRPSHSSSSAAAICRR